MATPTDTPPTSTTGTTTAKIPTTPATATTAGGLVRGVHADGVHTFLAIPFAAPPTGERRFRPPEPASPWPGVRDCTRPGPTAPQPILPTGLVPQTIIEGDDCVHLNVHTPALAGSRPVLVWIHGGGMVMGGNADVDGRALARRGLVVVAVNYRLGCDGFLCLEDAPLNRAVHDWLAAPAWVRDNIAALGRLRRIGPGLERGAGVLLVVLGVLLATGWYRYVSSYLARFAPAMGGL